MIYRIPPLPFSIADGDRSGNVPAIPAGQGVDFLSLLVQTMAGINGKAGSFMAGPVPAPPPVCLTKAEPEEAEPEGESRKEIFRFVFQQEGGAYVAQDGGKESSRYGILQATANRYGYQGNVKNMSRSEAEAIYEKIWQESGARDLPHDLALVHFDTYVNSPAAAKKMLKSSGGDTATYLDLRSQRYLRLSALRPETYAKYTKGWMNRVQNLRTLTAGNMNTSTARAST